LTEQRRIVDILEDHLSRLDSATQGLDLASARLAILQDRFIRATLLGESAPGAREPGSLEHAGVDDGHIPALPEGWHWRRLGELAEVVGGITKDAKRQSDPQLVETPYLRVANVQRGRLDLTHVTTIKVPASRARALQLQPGDVLLNEGGDRDKLARGWIWEGQIDRCIYQNHVFRARIRDDQIDPRLLSWAANTLGAPWAERNGRQSVNLASISLSKIRLMPIPVPPRRLQSRLAEAITDQLQTIDRLITELVSARRRSTALRRALLHAAFSGRLTARAIDSEMVEELSGV
jgi:type I restriction enzyme S subunit